MRWKIVPQLPNENNGTCVEFNCRVLKSKGMSVSDASAVWFLSVLGATTSAAMPLAPHLKEAILSSTRYWMELKIAVSVLVWPENVFFFHNCLIVLFQNISTPHPPDPSSPPAPIPCIPQPHM